MNIISFIKSAIIPVLVCAGTSVLFISCEPETVNDGVLDVNVENSADMKASMKEYPLKELAKLRASIAPYHNFELAYAAGYTLEVTGYRSQMGFHYLNPALLDDTFEVSKPELLLYIPGPNGKLRFVGVEYAIPIEDLNNPPPVPEGFTGDADQWVINTEFKLWTLHAWVGLHNPNGIFASRNPNVP